MTRTTRFLSAAALLLGLWPAAAAQEIVKEKVSVVNVEVPVRVFLAGAPLAGLSKDDFRLSEGREEQRINGFTVRRKKIGLQRIELRPEDAPPAPRYFVLVFRVIDHNEQLQAGVRYLFDHLLNERDRLLLLVNDRSLLLTPALPLSARREVVLRLLGEEALASRQRLEKYFLTVQKDLDQTRLRMLLERDSNFYAPRVIDFLDRYLRTWSEFKAKYLVPDLDKFYNFARHLEQVREEKWVLAFYQVEMFPSMKLSGQIHQQIVQLISELQVARPEDALHARIIEQLLERIDRELNAADSFPVDEVSKMLVKVDTTYHCFMMGTQREALSEDLTFKKVASDIENSLREVTRRSGGQVAFTGDIGSALHRIEEQEDVYYVLTYEPRDPGRREKVKVELPGYAGARLFYDDNIRADYIGDYLKRRRAEDPEVLIEALRLDGRRLSVALSSFKMAAARKGREGRLNVAIRIRDAQDRQIYDQSRPFSVKEPRAELTVDFRFLAPGRYMFLVEAHDLLTGKTAMDILEAETR